MISQHKYVISIKYSCVGWWFVILVKMPHVLMYYSILVYNCIFYLLTHFQSIWVQCCDITMWWSATSDTSSQPFIFCMEYALKHLSWFSDHPRIGNKHLQISVRLRSCLLLISIVLYKRDLFYCTFLCLCLKDGCIKSWNI